MGRIAGGYSTTFSSWHTTYGYRELVLSPIGVNNRRKRLHKALKEKRKAIEERDKRHEEARISSLGP